MFTRSQYMAVSNDSTAFRRYYAQFVTPQIKQRVLLAFGTERLRKAFAEDEHFNNIPLHRWDTLALYNDTAAKLREAGDWLSLGTQVCILKEAARQVVEEKTDEVAIR